MITEKFNASEKAKLVAKWRRMLEHKKMAPLSNRKKPIVAAMLENLYKRSKGLLKEDTAKLTTQDIQTFDTVLIPMIRRIAPELIALDILGTQVMEKPSQLIFALRAFPAGRADFDTVDGDPKNGKVDGKEHFGYALPGGRTKTSRDFSERIGMILIIEKTDDDGYFGKTAVETSGSENFAGIIKNHTHMGYFLDDYAPKGSKEIVLYGANAKLIEDEGTSDVSIELTSDKKARGTVYYVEQTPTEFKVIVGLEPRDVSGVEYFDFNKWMYVSNEDFDDSTNPASISLTKLIDVFDNEIMYNVVFKGYSGTYTTSEMEQFRTWNEIKFDIASTNVEAKGRLLKSRYSLEVAEDLMAYHNLDAEEELMNMISYEILAEMNREVVEEIYKAAISGGNGIYTWTYGNQTEGADGRWAAEKYHSLYTLMNKMAGDIAISTRRGTANFAICSMATRVALESVGGYSLWTDVNNNFNSNAGVVYAGTLGGKYKIYVDTFATSDYVLMGYKGSSEYDAGLFYCPFIPLTAVKAIQPENFTPRLGFRTRYAIGKNPLGENLYYRLCAINGLNDSFGATYSYVPSV